MAEKVDAKDLMKQYGAKLEGELAGYAAGSESGQEYSKSYLQFRGEMIPEFSRYERWCKALGNYVSLKVSKKDQEKYGKYLATAHLNLTPSEVLAFSLAVLLLTLFGGIAVLIGIWYLTDAFSAVFLVLVVLISMFSFYYAYKSPERLALIWRLQASSQMVPAILYIVIYMKHTSNFERAVEFASKHLDPPLSLDFKKIFYDVEVGKFSSIKSSVDSYLERWRDYSLEFIEAFHLIESSLYEPSEERRVAVLERALQVILDGVYDKMLKYTHNVKSPLTNLYMLGIVLPTLSLAILPLASTMLEGVIQWYHLFVIFNLIVPFLVLYLTDSVLLARPGGYGETNLLEKNPLYYKYKSKRAHWIAFFFVLPLLLAGFLPLIIMSGLPHSLGLMLDAGGQPVWDYTWNEIGLGFLGNTGIFGIVETANGLSGPTGVLSLLLSLLVPFSIAAVFVIGYRARTKDLIVEREKTKEVEAEFTSSLFQLGNRMEDGLPAEMAFPKVAESSRGTAVAGFFQIVNENIQQLGMSLQEALFNPKRGAIVFYPSALIATSMGILLESVKKGLKVAARSMMSISAYIKNIKKINDRLNDLLADIVSDMKSNMTFLAPLLSGIVIGLAGMITLILSNLSVLFTSGPGEEATGGFAVGGSTLQNILGIFDVTLIIPPYWLQIVVGIYLIEIVFILTSTLVTIKSGRDPLESTYESGGNLKIAMLLYLVVAAISIIALTALGAVVMAGLGT